MANEAVQKLAELLAQSVQGPAQAKVAEQQLRGHEDSQGFSIMLLHVVADSSFPLQTRLAGALFFKNLIKRKWTDEEGNYKLPVQDVQGLKSEIIGLMIQLPKNLQVQIGEAVSIMADSDFPDKWQDLVPSLVNQLAVHDNKTTNSVLVVAHSIFRRWRPLFRSDELFKEIKLVLDQFCTPYLQLFQRTDQAIEQASGKQELETLLETMHLMTEIFFDLNCQDIPEFFEDHLKEFFGVFHKYLVYKNAAVETDDDDTSGVVENLKSSICEVLELYTQRYEDEFTPLLSNFVESTWSLLTATGTEPKYDLLVAKALAFLTSVAKNQRHAHIFEAPLEQVVESIVLPNMALRTSDEELFEDDPIEYIRRDLEGSDSDSRRRAATDFIRELTAHMEAKVTDVAMKYVNAYLAKYNANTSENWRDKDAASYLFSAIATKSAVTNAGVSNSNILLDVVGFFSANIAPDLVSANAQPILKVDAIKYIYTFRNQLTKEQLVDTFPMLKVHLESGSSEYVVYTYAAITIERILAIRENAGKGNLMFSKHDIAPVSKDLLTSLFSLIFRASTPEKLAENEFLIKCIMRILITTQDAVAPYGEEVLHQLAKIVAEISKNPSNPRFSHYTFEAIGSLIRFCAPTLGASKFEEQLMPVFLNILQQDITEFAPYVFQLLSQLLRANPRDSGLPQSYQALIKPLMAPALWQTKGNVQALVPLLQAILVHGGSDAIVATQQLEPLLGVFQKLVSSKVNDGFALDLLEEIFLGIPMSTLQQYVKVIGQLLLQRLQTSRTDRFVVRLCRFDYLLSAAENKPGLGPQFAMQIFDSVQDNIFGEVLNAFLLPNTLKIQGSDSRKTAAIGLVKLLTTQELTSGKYSSRFAASLDKLVELLQTEIAQPLDAEAASVAALAHELDSEEVQFGGSFSKLATASIKSVDPAPGIKDPRDYCIQQLRQLNQQANGQLLSMVDVSASTKEYLQNQGI